MRVRVTLKQLADSGKPIPDPQPLAKPLPSADSKPSESQLVGTWQPGPVENVLPGLIPRPAKLPRIGRWQVLPMPQEASCYLSPDGNVSGTEFGDEALQSMAGLSALQLLHLDGTKVTDDGLKHLACSGPC